MEYFQYCNLYKFAIPIENNKNKLKLLFKCLAIYLSIHLSFYMSLSIRLSIHLSMMMIMSINQGVPPLSVYNLSIYLRNLTIRLYFVFIKTTEKQSLWFMPLCLCSGHRSYKFKIDMKVSIDFMYYMYMCTK